MKTKGIICEEIRDRVREYLEEKEITNTELARLIGIDRSSFATYMNENAETLSQVTITKIEEGFTRLLESDSTQAAAPGSFLKTRDSRGVMFVCQCCQETGEPGLIYGRAGFGKTYTLQYYAKDPKAIYVVCNEAMNSRDLAKKIEQAIGLPKGKGSVDDRMDVVREFFSINKGYLLIIDEADKLMVDGSTKKIETLRALFDSKVVSIVLAGEPALYSMVNRYFKRLIDRMVFKYNLRGLKKDEAYDYMRACRIDDDAREEMVQFAVNDKNGSFRRFSRTFDNVLRVADGNVITTETIAQARSFMM